MRIPAGLLVCLALLTGTIGTANGRRPEPKGLVVVPAEPNEPPKPSLVPAPQTPKERVQSSSGRPVPPGGWVRIPFRDAKRRWRVNFSSSSPVDLYLLYPSIGPEGPLDPSRVASDTRKKWKQVTEIRDDTFLPWHHEVGSGRVWPFYLHNPGGQTAYVSFSVDTSGKATPKEERWIPLHVLASLGLFAGSLLILRRILRWRLSRTRRRN